MLIELFPLDFEASTTRVRSSYYQLQWQLIIFNLHYETLSNTLSEVAGEAWNEVLVALPFQSKRGGEVRSTLPQPKSAAPEKQYANSHCKNNILITLIHEGRHKFPTTALEKHLSNWSLQLQRCDKIWWLISAAFNMLSPDAVHHSTNRTDHLRRSK